MLTKSGQLRQDVGCVSYEDSVVQKKPCKDDDQTQQWVFTKVGLPFQPAVYPALSVSTNYTAEYTACISMRLLPRPEAAYLASIVIYLHIYTTLYIV
jgi:hypothetical protein